MVDSRDLAEAIIMASTERDGRAVLTCAAAFRVARDMGVSLAEVAPICNAEKIKIVQCQLGCFK